MADKTLLILGNGFDKAHILKSTGKPLPTGYRDFLTYLAQKHSDAFRKLDSMPLADKDIVPVAKPDFTLEVQDTEIVKEINHAIERNDTETAYEKVNKYIDLHTNFWLLLFRTRATALGELWMDFEKEIANVVSFLEATLLSRKIPKKFVYIKNFLPVIDKLSEDEIRTQLIPHLETDLWHVMLLLEEYLHNTIDTLRFDDMKSVPDIVYKQNNIHAVVSYNYTHLFTRLYPEAFIHFTKSLDFGVEDDPSIYYIHGELTKHNLVLGAGETLDKSRILSMVDCNSFKKYFQAIYFHLNNNYATYFKDRLQEYRNWQMYPEEKPVKIKKAKWDVVVYGHSLDTTDKDSLKAIMTNKLVDKIVIYYYDNNALKRQIMNATQILGKKRLRKWEAKKKLTFKSISAVED